MKKKTNDEFIKEAIEIHGNRYSYEHCNYIGYLKPVTITCKIHGDFNIRADHFLDGKGCRTCSIEKNSKNRILKNDEFIHKAKKIHGDKYSYEKCNYTGNKNDVIITCPIHGDFIQNAANHLEGCGCKKCSIEKNSAKKSYTFEEFVERAYEIHGPKYLYYRDGYKNNKSKVLIVCQEHGKFTQQAQAHLNGQGCPHCGKEKSKLTLPKKKTNDEFIKEAKEVHGDKYDYSKTLYNGKDKNVFIICKKHGIFSQKANNHLNGSGCPMCKRSILEEKTAKILDDKAIKYEEHINKKRFYWLKNQHLDFYLPNYNVAIECQGIQHFEPVDFAGKGEQWAKRKLYTTKALDKIKYERCAENLVDVEYINYNDNVEERVNEIIDKYENKESVVETPTVNLDE